MPDAFDPLFDELASINAELASIAVRLATLEERQPAAGGAAGEGGAGGGPSDRAAGAPVLWRSMSAEQRVALWPEFVAWVVWLADAYELTTEQLPRQCWWQHASVVEELTALWTSHSSAYASEEDVGASPYLWQDALARAIERINRNWLGGCVNGFHEPKSRIAFADAAYRTGLLEAGPPGEAEPPDSAGTVEPVEPPPAAS
ncbi:hypothetical protein ABT263_35805 [Kitasatospora sp. NPDC001603]|uniref:hypothetical protein n=1 Tax=Kitasatospora sp. NPDC001603 TaxID=3154388 RepID=UPI00331EF341